MSRRNPSPAESLVQLPWQVSAVLAVVAFVTLRWVLPAIGSKNQILNTFMQGARGFAWPALFILGILAVFSAILSKKKRALLDTQKDATSLRALSWKEFERLVGEAYRRQGYAVEESLGGGADGGIDLIIRKGGGTWLVQCKQWKVQAVGAPVIREIFGLVNHHQTNGAIVITSGRFTREARAFAEGKTLELIDGPALLQLVKGVQGNRTSAEIPSPRPQPVAPSLPVTVPSCPKCGGGSYGLPMREFAEALNHDFPHAAVRLGGCVIMNDSPRETPAYVCPVCDAAYQAWKPSSQ